MQPFCLIVSRHGSIAVVMFELSSALCTVCVYRFWDFASFALLLTCIVPYYLNNGMSRTLVFSHNVVLLMLEEFIYVSSHTMFFRSNTQMHADTQT